ncbi:7117_t:CDS:2, partial [Racocetra persica]
NRVANHNKDEPLDLKSPWEKGEVRCLDVLTPTPGIILNPNDRAWIRWQKTKSCNPLTPLSNFEIKLHDLPSVKGSFNDSNGVEAMVFGLTGPITITRKATTAPKTYFSPIGMKKGQQTSNCDSVISDLFMSRN